jgi:DNA-binding CsgD family transcriptional regulator
VLGRLMGRVTQPAGVVGKLTDRELQVFRLAGRALSTRAIAEKLGVSVKTVEAHRENIKGKLGVETHTALVARAAQWLRESG